MKLTCGALVIGCLCSLPGQAFAQAEHRPTISGNASAAAVDSTTEFSFAGTLGYRYNEILGFEVEATLIPTIHNGLGSVAVAGGGAMNASGAISHEGMDLRVAGHDPDSAAIFSANARFELPTTSARLTPYAVGGGGLARVRHLSPVLGPLQGSPAQPNGTTSAGGNADIGHWYSTDLAMTLGGGLDVRVLKHLSAEADLRFIRLFGDTNRNVGRFGAGLRYVF